MGFGIRTGAPSPGLMARFTSRLRDASALLALLFLVITFTPVTLWWTSLLEGPADSEPGRVMVVLAASSMDEDILGQGSYLRAAFAVREMRKGRYERVLLSGWVGTKPSAAAEMKKFLVASGVDAKLIELEEKSSSTRQNAEFCAPLLRGEKRPIALVTSDYHMRRSASAYEKVGLRVLRRPYPDVRARAVNRSYRFELAYELAVETTKLVYYKLRGWA